VAQAYIADITPPAERSKKMGLIGMAFGLGFILGPVLGILAYTFFGSTGPGWAASALCAMNFILAFRILPESWKPSADHAPQRPHFDQWIHTLRQPKLGLLVGVFFLATFCFTCFETTLGLLMLQKFDIDYKTRQGAIQVGLLFMYAGLVGAVFQGGATGRLVKMLGEPKLVAVSLFCVALSLGPMPFANTKLGIYLLLALLSIGSSMTRPPVFGMISNLTNAREQGVTIGVAQSAGGLARVIGPTFSSTLFFWISWLPYVICGALALLTGLIAWQFLSRNYVAPVPAEAPLPEA
jgi:MFS family permease